VARRTGACYGIGETPAPNRQGAVTNVVYSSHGNDIDSDGACVTGPQPYSEGENESFAGMLPVPSECGLEPDRSVPQAGHPVAGCHGLQAVEEVTYSGHFPVADSLIDELDADNFELHPTSRAFGDTDVPSMDGRDLVDDPEAEPGAVVGCRVARLEHLLAL
jgi:hypothetical protein